MLKHAVCHLLMGWMFQFVFGTYLGLTWDLLGKDNAHIAVIIIRRHPERIPKTSRRNTI